MLSRTELTMSCEMCCSGVLDVLHCVLIDSPEALNVIKEQHIRTVISLIDKHGRDPKVQALVLSNYLSTKHTQ